MKAILVTAFVLSATFTAKAQDSTTTLTPNVGLVEIMTMSQTEHVGLYGYAGVSRPITISETTTLLPSLSVEWSPELGNWGLVAGATADLLVSETVGLDAQLLVVHDQPGWEFSEAQFYCGPGVGISLHFGSITLSPSANAFYGLSDGGWSLVPVLNVSW